MNKLLSRSNTDAGVYSILCTASQKRYIGSSVDVPTRLAHHKSALQRGDHPNRHLQNSWNKHGVIAFEFESILECDLDAVRVWEKRIIDAVKPAFNSRGTDPERNLLAASIETRQKMSAVRRGRKVGPYSDERKKNISLAKTGHPMHPRTRAAIRAAHLGRKLSAEHKEALRNSNVGRPMSDRARSALLAVHLGKPVSAKTKAKISATLRGRTKSSKECL